MSARHVAMSRTGRYVAMQRAASPGAIAGLEIVDVLGTSPRVRVDGAGRAIDFACVGDALWLLRDRRIDRVALATGRALAPIALATRGTGLVPDRGEGAHAAIVLGDEPVLVLATPPAVELAGLPAEASLLAPLGGRSYAAAFGDRVQILDLGRREPVGELRTGDRVVDVHALYGGRLIAVLARSEAEDTWWVVRRDGARVHRIVTARASRWAVARDAGVALAAIDERWIRVDLRYGQARPDGATRSAICELELSADGQYVLLAQGDPACPAIEHLPVTELSASAHAKPVLVEVPAAAEPLDAARPVAPAAPREPAALGDVPLPLALGAPLPALTIAATSAWPPYATPREHLDDMLDLVAARTARAIALAWNSGRLSASIERQPFFREVRALLGEVAGFATDELAEADARLAAMAERTAGRIRATVAAGIRLPFIELMRELDLSPMAGHVLLVALAPGERGEIARLFGILGNDPQRPLVDRHLLETVLGGADRAARAEVAAELAEGAPLRRHRVIHAAGDPGLAVFQGITVDLIVVARLCERPGAAHDREPARAIRPLDQLVVPRDVLHELAALLARPRPASAPLRLVMRGRLGSGRRSMLAALAARVERTIRDVDCARLSRTGAALASELERELARAVLLGAIPIVSGLEAIDPGDLDGQDRIRHVLREHPGPLVIRTSAEASLPLDRGFATITLPALSETDRDRFWRAALARAALVSDDVPGLAARWRMGPGLIERVITAVAAQGVAGDATAALDDAARQHIASRLDHVATRVQRLAAWENVALPDDAIDSIREFIGRIAQRRTVFEDWGFDGKVASARGLTALFYGPPGTGKSMVAGLVARELGLELYRIDLARVVSKWIGETEKQLAEVFDAAEAGQVVLLFDEADSLFAKRTEVKSSVDRYANLEVNYLLQRLDTFEGIAILTTNLDGSIDPAFKRRMSLRLQFPFPDVDMRQRLWATHIPTEAPVAGDFDFAELARRFPLSGGYIRNSTLRAAFLAAQERRPLGQQHLLRAITLEYRELGKLATDGRME